MLGGEKRATVELGDVVRDYKVKIYLLKDKSLHGKH